MNIQDTENLKKVCQPVMDYMTKHFDPYCTLVITDSGFKLVRDEASVPNEKAANPSED